MASSERKTLASSEAHSPNVEAAEIAGGSTDTSKSSSSSSTGLATPPPPNSARTTPVNTPGVSFSSPTTTAKRASQKQAAAGATPVAGGMIHSAANTPKTPSMKTPTSRTSASNATGGAAASASGAAPSARKTPGAKTPSHNYSNTHTPIASAKRPRASLGGRSTSRTGGGASKGGRMGPGPNSTKNLASAIASPSAAVAASHTIRRTSTVTIATPAGDVTAASSQESAGSKSSTDSLKENNNIGGSSPATASSAVMSPATSSPTDVGTARVATPVNLTSTYSSAADDTLAPPPTPGLPMSPMHPARPMRSHSPTHGGGDDDCHESGTPAEAVDGAATSNDEEGGGSGGWKINNIFSPVLHFLGGSKDEEEEEADGRGDHHAADVEVEQEQGEVGADARHLAAAEGLVNLNESGNEGYATAEEGANPEDVDVDGDVTMEDVEVAAASSQLSSPAYVNVRSAHTSTVAVSDSNGHIKSIDSTTATNGGEQLQHHNEHPNAVYQVHTHESTTTTTTATYSRSSPRSHDGMGQEYSFESSVEGGDAVDTYADADAEIHHASSEESVEIHAEESQEEDEEEEFNPYLFIKSLPNYNLIVPYPHHKICLPPKESVDPPIALVLDLDETLVHCTVEPIPDADMVFPVVFNGVEYSVNVRKRPYLEEFLQRVAGKFEVIVFTASQQVYADELLNRIDPGGKYIKHRMFRESCLAVEGNYLKDLNVCGRDMKKMVLVDNSPHAFGYQVDNGIPIESWFDDPTDTELLKLERFLRTLHSVDDVRTAVRERFRSWELIKNA